MHSKHPKAPKSLGSKGPSSSCTTMSASSNNGAGPSTRPHNNEAVPSTVTPINDAGLTYFLASQVTPSSPALQLDISQPHVFMPREPMFYTPATPSLRRTMRTVEVENPSICRQCTLPFADNNSLKRHVQRMHSEPGKLHCVLCDEPMKSKVNLERHCKAVHPTDAKFSCQVCDVPFNATKTLALHKLKRHGIPLLHHGRGRKRNLLAEGPRKTIRKHKCSACQYSSDWRTNVTRHYEAIHLKFKIFVCPHCYKCFAMKANLMVHKCQTKRIYDDKNNKRA